MFCLRSQTALRGMNIEDLWDKVGFQASFPAPSLTKRVPSGHSIGASGKWIQVLEKP